MKKVLSFLLALCFCPYLARADTPPVPDLKGWSVVSASYIEIRISDNSVAYLGSEIEYQNPHIPEEFARVISRHIPLIIFKRRLTDGRLFKEMIISSYAQKAEQERLKKLSSEADPILYVRWRIRPDLHTGKNLKEGDTNIWFLRPNFLRPDDKWIFSQNDQVSVQLLSESVDSGKQHNVFVGIKYQVGAYYHILKANRRDIIRSMEESK